MALTPDPFAHQALAQLREERLARKAARYQAIGYSRRGPSLRRPLAAALHGLANWLAPQPEPAPPAASRPNHVHVYPNGQPGTPSKG